VKDYGKIGNCNDTYCEYFDESMELNCAYSEDNSKCIKTIEPLSSHAVLAEGWRDSRKELPADGEQVLWALSWEGNCDQGLESPDEYEYIYGRYYEEMEVVRLPWSDKEYKVKWMNYWRRIDPPALS